MKKILFKGAGSAVPTPFTNDGVNLKEFEKFLQFQRPQCVYKTLSEVKKFAI